MLRRRIFPVAVVAGAVLVIAACGSSTHRYSAERFKQCMAGRHADVTLTRDVTSRSTAALVWQETFAEWLYFYRTAEAAHSDLKKLKTSSVAEQRRFTRLFKAQRSNVLIFAPAQSEWLSSIEGCLQKSSI